MQQRQNEQRLVSERPATTAAARILTPNLIVLLGSTSAISGLELMRHMLSLQQNDQRRVALVYIDTDDPPAPLVEFRRQHNNVFLEFPLRIAVPAGVSNAARIDESDQHTFIKERIPQYFANGAGGIRNNGHVAACFNYQYIYDVLDRAVMAISRLSTEQNATKVHEIQANIVAFLGGGTGSGILPDIAIMVRDILTHRLYKQRINLFCMLPEPISGSTVNDLHWRKSNATACLLEVMAYSRAAAPTANEGYKKYMRGKMHRLTNDPIANEVYLIGHASMDSAGDAARIVGLDLFQRTTDASGVGFLEHSKWVDRRTLGAEDDRGLPTMFGTSCPVEVRFPAEETATAYAQISAARLLPLLADYQPAPVRISDPEKQEWRKKWRNVARIDANTSDPLTIKLDEFRADDFENASQAHLDLLWNRLIRFEQNLDLRMKELIDHKRQEEQGFIKDTPPLAEGEQSSLINRRIQHLNRLQQEYDFMLNDLKEREAPRVPQRPNELESKLTRQPNLPGPLRRLSRDYASALTGEYNERMHIHARAVRHQMLEQLFKELRQQVQFALEQSMTWFYNTGANERIKDLLDKGLSSMAWHGHLEYAHPHQRHLFDLSTLQTQDDHNIAAERLYYWATGGDKALQETDLDFKGFVGPCVEYITQHAPSGEKLNSIDRQVAGRLAERVVDYFRTYYLAKFANRNLFDLLFIASPLPRSGQSRQEQVSNYLLQHMQHIRGLMSSLVTFEAELWQEGLASLDTSVYLGIHWHDDGGQQELFEATLDMLGSVTQRGQLATVNRSLDPHRLQVSYGQHAISISTIRDFYLEQNSAMEYYREYQNLWHQSQGNGLMPVHSSGEAERLVTDPHALGYKVELTELVIRRPKGASGPGGSGPGGPGAAGFGGGVNGQKASTGPRSGWDEL